MDEEMVDWLYKDSYSETNNCLGMHIEPGDRHFTSLGNSWEDRNNAIFEDDDD